MTLAFDDLGGTDPAVVLLPMFAMTRTATAAAFRPALAGSGLRQLYPDLPGHGDSPAGCPPEAEAVLDTMATWIEQRAGGPVLLAGGSYGGYLAAGIARRRPALVRGLLLVCPGVTIDADSRDLPPAGPAPALPGWLDAVPDTLRGHLDMALGRRTPEVARTVLDAITPLDHGDEAFRRELREGPRRALPDEDADVTFEGPVAVITGRQDRIVGYADQFRAMRHYPHGSFTVIDEAGHYLPYEQPEALKATVDEWLRRALR